MINRDDSQEITRAILSVVVIALVGWVLWSLFIRVIPSENRDAVMMVLGALLLRLSDVYAFHFNSTANSQRKDQTIQKAVETVQEVAKLPPIASADTIVPVKPGDSVEVVGISKTE